jgi:hypothetical protein
MVYIVDNNKNMKCSKLHKSYNTYTRIHESITQKFFNNIRLYVSMNAIGIHIHNQCKNVN